jgi:hypothetical protein
MNRWLVDSGHGWLQVEREELIALGIADKISGFSYVKGEYVYLEEDCDASLYLNVIGKRSTDFPETYYKNDAPCRNYNHYRGA